MKIISVHVPKCGGMSTRQVLKRHYGNDPKLRLDYDDRLGNPESFANLDPLGFIKKSLSDPQNNLQGVDIVHGHFRVSKYDNVKSALRVTSLRHPIDRLISFYFYQRSRPPKPHDHSIARAIQSGDVSLAQISALPHIQKFYREVYFRDVDMKIFDYIADLGNGLSQTDYISQALGLDLNNLHINKNRTEGYQDLVEDIKSDQALMRELADNLRGDIEFYQRHVS